MSSPSPRQTKLQLISNQVDTVEKAIESLLINPEIWPTPEAQDSVSMISNLLDQVGRDLPKLVQKASETNPDKRTYGKAVAEKILKLDQDHRTASKDFHQISQKILAVQPSKPEVIEETAQQAALSSIIAKEPKLSGSGSETQRDSNELQAIGSALEKANIPENKGTKVEATDDRAASASLERAGSLSTAPKDESSLPRELDAERKELEAEKQSPLIEEGSNQGDVEQVPINSQQENEVSSKDSSNAVSSSQTPPINLSDEAKSVDDLSQRPPTLPSQSAAEQSGTAGKVEDEKAVEKLRGLRARWETEGKSSSMEAAVQLLRRSPWELTGGAQELMHILQAAKLSGSSVLVDFSAKWCGPCRAMKPLLVQSAEEWRGKVCIVTIDCEETAENRNLAAEAGISAFPTFHIYYGQDRKLAFKGGRSYADLKALLSAHVRENHTSNQQEGRMSTKLGQMMKIVYSMVLVKETASEQEYQELCRLLQKILQNIRDYPQDPKYRTLKAENKKFQGSFLRFRHAEKLLEAIGFYPLHSAAGVTFHGTDVQEDVVQETLELIPLAFESFEKLSAFSKYNDDADQMASQTAENRSALQLPSSDPKVLAEFLARILLEAPSLSGQGI